MPLVVDHIVPRGHGGGDDFENLGAACYRCKEFKGPRTHAQDPVTNQLLPLYNPRTQSWIDHFHWANQYEYI
jgi:5-methylcytosine-specific restriction endonuclease McrA